MNTVALLVGYAVMGAAGLFLAACLVFFACGIAWSSFRTARGLYWLHQDLHQVPVRDRTKEKA